MYTQRTVKLFRQAVFVTSASLALVKGRRKKKKNLLCNFRAPDAHAYQDWQEWTDVCKNVLHSDVCYVTLSAIRAIKKAIKDGISQTQILTPTTIININQQNTFHYIVSRARRKAPIEGIPMCETKHCKNPAKYKLHHKNLGKDYRLCPKHKDQYEQYADKITPLPLPDNIEFI